MSSQPHSSDLEERLLRLEKQNRRLKQLGVAALIVVASALVMGQAPANKTVEANEFVLRDASGRVRARLAMKMSPDRKFDYPDMVLLDPKGQARIELFGSNGGDVESSHAGLVLYDAKGQVRMNVGTGASSSSLSLSDAEGNVRVSLDQMDFSAEDIARSTEDIARYGSVGTASLIVSSKKLGKAYTSLSTDGVIVYSKAGAGTNVNVDSVQVSDAEGFSATLGTKNLVTPRTGETHKTSAASLLLFDKGKNVIWKAP
jgi:hypothetical protein